MTACCATLVSSGGSPSAGASSACESEVSAAQAQSDAQTACGVLLQGYQSEGLCGSASNGSDAGTQPTAMPDGSTPASDGSPASSSISGVTLTVQSSQQITSFGSYSISNGTSGSNDQVWVAVSLTLDNGSTSTLPLSFTLFAANTTGGIQYTANAETGLYPDGCDPTTSLTSGHATSCSLLFQTPSTAVTTTLAYALPNGSPVSVPLITTTCTVCAGACTDLTTDPKNCGACGNAIDQSGTCQNGMLVCQSGATACGATCTDTQTDSSNCGTCGNTCGLLGIIPGNCVGGACTACMPGAFSCATSTSGETCGSNGEWETPVPCPDGEVCSDDIQSYIGCEPAP